MVSTPELLFGSSLAFSPPKESPGHTAQFPVPWLFQSLSVIDKFPVWLSSLHSMGNPPKLRLA